MSGKLARWLPWAAALFGAVYLGAQALPRGERGVLDVRAFGELPVVYAGRVKPYDTLARNALMVISKRRTYVDAAGQRRPAVRWLLDVAARPQEAGRHAVFRIENQQVLDLLGLEPRAGLRYALSEFGTTDNIRRIEQQARAAAGKEPEQRDVFDRRINELYRRLQLYHGLAESHAFLPQVRSAEEVQQLVQRYAALRDMGVPHAVPPASEGDEWQPFMLAQFQLEIERAMAVRDQSDPPQPDPALRSLSAILAAYQQGDAETFNSEVAAYHRWLDGRMPEQMRQVRFEAWYNRFQPFYHSAVMYVLGFVLVCLGWLGWTKPLVRAAVALALVTLAVHTFALLARMYLMDRPLVFVTNPYSSAVFIGWAAVGVGLVLEWLFRNGIGAAVAAVTGFIGLVIAINLAGDGTDTLGVQQAVLDTNFWLATHVTTVTLGYAATFLAGVLGIVFVLRGVLTRTLGPEAVKSMGRMIYGVICFALFLSFTGTVLGGIWADQSWGRFWGWDPKENGALIIVLWNALILHARWGGMVQQRGVAVMAIFGNIVTAWSWFGTNMLGAGLHSYGFMDGAVGWLVAFVLSQLALIAVGSLPLHLWRSFSDSRRLQRHPVARPGAQPDVGLAR